MLIKAVTKKGDPVVFTAKESLKYAVAYGAKSMNTLENIYWLGNQPIVEESFQSHNDEKGQWKEAFATGYCYIGKTDAKTDRFYQEKKYRFDIQYTLAKDAVGLPDLKINKFVTEVVETNPAKMVGEVATDSSTDQVAMLGGEIVAEKTGSEIAQPIEPPEMPGPILTPPRTSSVKRVTK